MLPQKNGEIISDVQLRALTVCKKTPLFSSGKINHTGVLFA